ncbi:MAG: uroporphyrinogen-III C-methyltransferase [Burkholderiales bacterium]|nr:uroporphyrinogen-III C-methyltransferase [Burkholderiales bacterium]
MTPTLVNRRFLVTRPESQSDRLAELLREEGAEPILAPMIAIGETSDPAALDDVLGRLGDFDLAVFVSPTALDQVAGRIAQWPADLPAAVIGPASRDRALELGLADVIVPENRYDSEGLLEHPNLQQMAGKRVVLFRGNGGRELLAETLAARGATVEIVEAYRRLPPTIASDALAAMMEGGCDGVIVTSSEAVHNLFAVADESLREHLLGLLFFASHPAIADSVRRQGVGRVIGTASGDAGIVATLKECFAGAAAGSAPAAAMAPLGGLPIARRRRMAPHVRWALGVGVVSLLVTLVLFFSGRRDLHGEIGSRLASVETRLQQHEAVEQQNDLRIGETSGKLAETDQHVEELRAQAADLRALYSAVAGDQEEAMLADAELTLSLASQQLQLTGNVGSTLAALYRLDERLAGHDQPRLQPLRRALARDIDALKRVPWVDYVGLSAKLDSLASGVDKLSLVVDGKAGAEAAQTPETRTDGLLGEFGRAIGALITIRRIDQPDPVLLAPEQSLYLREHVKLRLLNARLALLQRDDATFRLDLAAADTELRRHFDTKSDGVKKTLESLKELAALRPSGELPDLNSSLNAARDARRTVQKEVKQ